jgi:hypothetical protein
MKLIPIPRFYPLLSISDDDNSYDIEQELSFVFTSSQDMGPENILQCYRTMDLSNLKVGGKHTEQQKKE